MEVRIKTEQEMAHLYVHECDSYSRYWKGIFGNHVRYLDVMLGKTFEVIGRPNNEKCVYINYIDLDIPTNITRWCIHPGHYDIVNDTITLPEELFKL